MVDNHIESGLTINSMDKTKSIIFSWNISTRIDLDRDDVSMTNTEDVNSIDIFSLKCFTCSIDDICILARITPITVTAKSPVSWVIDSLRLKVPKTRHRTMADFKYSGK